MATAMGLWKILGDSNLQSLHYEIGKSYRREVR